MEHLWKTYKSEKIEEIVVSDRCTSSKISMKIMSWDDEIFFKNCVIKSILIIKSDIYYIYIFYPSIAQ